MEFLLFILGPTALGCVSWWIAGKCRGRNARNAFRFGAWGFWLLLLRFFAGVLPGIFPLTWLLLLIPSFICFLLAGQSILKEMRAQQRGDYTERV